MSGFARFFLAGGFPMWIVTIFGVACLVTAIRFALRADARKLAVVRALTWATVFAILSGVLSDFMAVMWKVPENPEWANSPELHLIIMVGLGEAVTPGVLGFTLLALAWLFVAIGTRRLQDRD
jgi:hypothetical protein